MEFLVLLADRLSERTISRDLGHHTEDSQLLEDIANVNDETRQKIREILDTDKSRTKLENCLVETIAFIIGHELGHIVHQDYKTGKLLEDSRKSEIAADKFSIELMIKTRLSILSVLPYLNTIGLAGFAMANKNTGIAIGKYINELNHPFALCRSRYILESGVRQLENDPVFIASFDNDVDAREEWEGYKVRMQALMKSLETTAMCRENGWMK